MVFFLFSWFFLLHFFVCRPGVNAAHPVVRLEAENGVYREMILSQDDSAFGGRYLKMGTSGSVQWKVSLPSEGWHEIRFRYRSPQSDKEQALVRNGQSYAIGFGYSPTWKTTTTRTFLRRGLNDIALQAGWGEMDVDCADVLPVEIPPEISPEHNVFYEDAPRDLSFLVKAFGHRLRSITCGKETIPFKTVPFRFWEDAFHAVLPGHALSRLNRGEKALDFLFEGGLARRVWLDVREAPSGHALTIAAPDVDHGGATLFILPDGKTLLVDCAQREIRDSVLIPFLHRNGINRLDYFIITHYHPDHDAGDKGETIKRMFRVRRFYDYRSFKSGDSLSLGGAGVKILNAYGDGEDENTRSLCFRLEYKGFVYHHGGDVYGADQKRILERFPQNVASDVLHANHHFHGSVDVDFLRAARPSMVIVQAQQAIYARSAYMEGFLEGFVQWLSKIAGTAVETLPTLEVGTVVVRVNGKTDWTYETYGNGREAVIPRLF